VLTLAGAAPTPWWGSQSQAKIGCVTALEGRILLFANRSNPMAKQQSDSVYRIVDVVGVSEESWEDAGRNAVETAASSLRDLRVAEVTKMDMRVENGKVTAFRTRVALSFKYEA
jgi:dodecin